MPTVIKLTYYHYHSRGLYACDQPADQSGEYVPLAEYEVLEATVRGITADYNQMDSEHLRHKLDLAFKNDDLRRLIKRVIEVNGRAVGGDKLYLSELTGLLADCRKALEGI